MSQFGRTLRIAALPALLALRFGNPALAARPPATETPTRTILVIVNGQSLDTEQGARIVGGHVMLPLRVVFDALGVPVVKSGNTITGQLPTGRIVMTVGSSNATVNGRSVRLDAPVAAIDGTEYVPLRFFGDALGATTSYDGRGSKVEIVSALIGRNAGDQQTAGGGTRVRGIIAEVDRNVEPPTITVNVRGEARTISVNSDARVYVEDVTINSQLKGTLSDMRVGDALLAVMAKNGKVVELHDFFRSTSGTVSAVSQAALVMSGGAVITPSASTEITLNESPAKLSDLHVGDEIAVRRNPETGEMRQIIASRKAPSTAAPASGVTISAFTISSTRPLRAGELLDVSMQGTPGGKATFDLGNYVTGNVMREDAPGVYRARYTIPDRFNVTDVPVWGHLTVNGVDAPRAQAPTRLSAATTPPSIVDVAPPAGQSVNSTRPNIYATFMSPGEIDINSSSIQLIVNGHDVTSSATRSPTFITYSPGVDYPDGPVSVTVRVADAAGNTASRSWSFTVRAK